MTVCFLLYVISLTHWPLFTVAGEEGDPSLDDKPGVERPPEVRLEPVQNTQAQQEQRYTPPPLSQPSDKCKSSVVCVSCEHVYTATTVQYYLTECLSPCSHGHHEFVSRTSR